MDRITRDPFAWPGFKQQKVPPSIIEFDRVSCYPKWIRESTRPFSSAKAHTFSSVPVPGSLSPAKKCRKALAHGFRRGHGNKRVDVKLWQHLFDSKDAPSCKLQTLMLCTHLPYPKLVQRGVSPKQNQGLLIRWDLNLITLNLKVPQALLRLLRFDVCWIPNCWVLSSGKPSWREQALKSPTKGHRAMEMFIESECDNPTTSEVEGCHHPPVYQQPLRSLDWQHHQSQWNLQAMAAEEACDAVWPGPLEDDESISGRNTKKHCRKQLWIRIHEVWDFA